MKHELISCDDLNLQLFNSPLPKELPKNPANYKKPSQNKDFGSRSRRIRVLIRPENITGSPTGILKYVEDLKRGSNAEVGPKDYFEIASN